MMKHNRYIVIIAIASMALISCGEKKNQNENAKAIEEIQEVEKQPTLIADASFSDEMTSKIFHNYQQIRSALTNSDASEVVTAAENLVVSLSEGSPEMKSMTLAMVNTDDIEKQRELFSQFTQKVEPLFKESITAGAIYKQFCPMAFNNKGGYWLSDVSEIKNPYYGEKMLKCGKVTETIEK
jgi:hypothetical protein